MTTNTRNVSRYGAAVASILVASFARWLLDPILGENVPYITYFVAVTFAAWYGGLGPGLLAVTLGAAAAAFLFIEPRNSILVHGLAHQLGMGLYLGLGILVVLLCESQRAAQRRAEEQREWLRVTLASIGDAVIATDDQGRVTFLNGVAESLTGWTREEAVGKPLENIFRIINEETK